MRNLILVLALGMAAGVQVTRELFPRFNSVAPAYDLIHRMESEIPSSKPATWLPPSSGADVSSDPAHLDNSECVEALPVAVTRPELAPRCWVHEQTASDRFLGL